MLRCFACLALAALTSVAWQSPPAATASPQINKDGQGDVASCTKIEGALVQHTKEGFKALKPGDRIPANIQLVGLPEAELVSKDGKVGIKLMLYLGETLPVTEAAIEFRDNAQVNADIVIDRGVVTIKNLAEKGGTHVRIHGGKQTWELDLKDPDSQVLVARFGRHAPGTNLFQTGDKKVLVDEPLEHFGILVLKGSVGVDTGSQSYTLHAPPGPALMTWESAAGFEVKRLEALPNDLQKLQPVDAKTREKACEIIAKLAAGDVNKGLDELVASDDMLKRRIAVACMGAFDDLPRLWGALENTKHRDVREQAVLTLRNWMGRQPGNLPKLREHLIKGRKLTAAQARTVTQLLKGFDERDRHEPLIYQLLIDGLEVGALPIRELAYWNLERLAPAGQNISYDAAADEAARKRAVEQWRRLIPEGHLPPAPKKDEVKKGK